MSRHIGCLFFLLFIGLSNLEIYACSRVARDWVPKEGRLKHPTFGTVSLLSTFIPAVGVALEGKNTNTNVALGVMTFDYITGCFVVGNFYPKSPEAGLKRIEETNAFRKKIYEKSLALYEAGRVPDKPVEPIYLVDESPKTEAEIRAYKWKIIEEQKHAGKISAAWTLLANTALFLSSQVDFNKSLAVGGVLASIGYLYADPNNIWTTNSLNDVKIGMNIRREYSGFRVIYSW